MDDREIIEMFFRREEQAMAAASRKYGGLIKSIWINICGAPEDFEECLNDTMLALWKSIPPERPRYFSAYISKIARNLSINALKRRPDISSLSISENIDELSLCIPSGADIQQEIEAKELADIINRFLETAAKRDRGIFIKRYFYGESIKEIAGFYNMRENAVKTALFRLRTKLRDRLEKEDYTI